MDDDRDGAATKCGAYVKIHPFRGKYDVEICNALTQATGH